MSSYVHVELPTPEKIAEMYPPGTSTVTIPEKGVVSACYGLRQSACNVMGRFGPPSWELLQHRDDILCKFRRRDVAGAIEAVTASPYLVGGSYGLPSGLAYCFRAWFRSWSNGRRCRTPKPANLWSEVSREEGQAVSGVDDPATFEILLLIGALLDCKKMWEERANNRWFELPLDQRGGAQLARCVRLGPAAELAARDGGNEWPRELESVLGRAMKTRDALILSRKGAMTHKQRSQSSKSSNLHLVASRFAYCFGARQVRYSDLLLAIIRYSALPEVRRLLDLMDFHLFVLTSVVCDDVDKPSHWPIDSHV
jgi:hypothetical protein